MFNLNVPPLLGPRVVSPHPQGLQGSHLNLSQTSAQRHRTYFLVNNKAVNEALFIFTKAQPRARTKSHDSTQ